MAREEGQQIDTLPSQQYGWKDNAPVRVVVDADGTQVVRDVAGGIVWDAITPTYNATSDVYVFSLNAATTGTITVNYTDATKSVLSGVTKVLA
jgi:hypothetical protein